MQTEIKPVCKFCGKEAGTKISLVGDAAFVNLCPEHEEWATHEIVDGKAVLIPGTKSFPLEGLYA